MQMVEYPLSLRQALSAIPEPTAEDAAALIAEAKKDAKLGPEWRDGPSPPVAHNPQGTQMVWWTD